MSFDIEYRPSSLEEFIGNDSVVAAVAAFLRDHERSHSILLFGPSGCGKTTLGRIIAKELGANMRPPNYMEFDIASARGINEMRERVIKPSKFAPLARSGEKKIKVFLLDEAHQLTKDAASLLLKPSEEPPDFLYYIFATTEPDKMLPTILTRCMKFEVRPLKKDEVRGLITQICDIENIASLEKSVIRKLVSVSEGCPRTALKLLEQVKDLDEEASLEMLGSGVFEVEILDICRLLADTQLSNTNKWKTIRKKLPALREDAEKVRMSILGYFGSALLRAENENKATHFALVLSHFMQPYHYIGKPGLYADLFMSCME